MKQIENNFAVSGFVGKDAESVSSQTQAWHASHWQ